MKLVVVPEKEKNNKKQKISRKKKTMTLKNKKKGKPLEGYLKPCARWQSRRPIRDYGSL